MSVNNFSDFLIKKRDEANLTNSKLAMKASISSVYLGEIINNKKIPPDKKTQYALVDALQLSLEDRNAFFSLAAKERGELPADVYDYLLNNHTLIYEIRQNKINKGE